MLCFFLTYFRSDPCPSTESFGVLLIVITSVQAWTNETCEQQLEK